MPATGLLALLDDIATMSKIAAQKTAAISGDDLAVNSKTLVGIDPKRELPIVYKVAKGSLRNKCILIPSALALNFFAPWAILPLLTLGGAYLCYEGIEKLVHKDDHGKDAATAPADMKELEKKKIASAIKTDLILSAEITVVTLGAVAAAPFITQVAVLGAIGLAMTVGIYGLVGGIVKLDDIGLHMAKKKGESPHAKFVRKCGNALVNAVPPLMKGISVVGTAAMFMVGGQLVLHGIPAVGHALTHFIEGAIASGFLQGAATTACSIVAGIATGLACIPAVKVLEKPMAFVVDKMADVIAPVAKVVRKAIKPLLNVFKKKRNPDAEETKVTAPPPPHPDEPVMVLQFAPDASKALNAAAAKPANDEKPAAVDKKPPAQKTPAP
ncbi:MAG: DUF808 domain-containing protein [Alphaproteobacteria bacterium]|nr:MAG: DUF808 domain-containing protein [Alphaproteobacteria bacterium]